MKIQLLAVLLVQLLFVSCSKDTAGGDTFSEPAIIVSTKYPCGPNCSAQGWLLVTSTSFTYEPVNLPESYKVPDLSVQVRLKRTGARSDQWGGTGQEFVQVIDISRR
jgi:hypothetical protein